MEHPFALGFGTVHLLNLFRGHRIAQIVRIIGSDHDVARANHSLQVFHCFDAVDQVVKVEVFEIRAGWFSRRERARAAATRVKTIIESP